MLIKTKLGLEGCVAGMRCHPQTNAQQCKLLLSDGTYRWIAKKNIKNSAAEIDESYIAHCSANSQTQPEESEAQPTGGELCSADAEPVVPSQHPRWGLSTPIQSLEAEDLQVTPQFDHEGNEYDYTQ